MRERTIVKAIQRGASTIDEVRAECRAATRCHGCEPAVLELLERHATGAVHAGSVRVSSVAVGLSA